jgi:hypothetical protein
MDRFVNVALLKEPVNWVIVPVVLILAGMALAFLMPSKPE